MIKIFEETTKENLEKVMNTFLENKTINSLSYSISKTILPLGDRSEYWSTYSCLVDYED